MTSTQDVIDRWVQEVRKSAPRYLRPSSVRVMIHRNRLYSYGTHFELARWVQATDEHRGFWLLNGDAYSVSTSRHQNLVQDAVKRTGDPVIILPHTPLRQARIDIESIVPVEITDDRFVTERVTVPLAKLPRWMTEHGSLEYYLKNGQVVDNHDGTYTREFSRHVLGESVFRATYTTYSREAGYQDISAWFLSAFDHQETNQHYFLCQLPGPAVSVKDALEVLRPQEVKDADRHGLTVTRQGDVFAVPAPISTREVRKLGESQRMAQLLGTSHIATEVVDTGDVLYARGILRHRPGFGRAPEHRAQKMLDGKTWHVIVRNTVPQENGQNRAWSVVGNVD